MKKLALITALALALGACDSDPDSGTVTPPPPPPPPNNSAPDIADQTFTTNEDQLLGDVIVASDPDGDAITFAIITPPVEGRIESFDTSTGDFVFRPGRDFNGDDSFEVRVTDPFGASATAVITVTSSCPPPQSQCSWDKFDLVDDPALQNASDPDIAIDTALRVNVAFVEDNSTAGGTVSDLFVYQSALTGGTTFTKTPGSGPNGALNDTGPAARPDLGSSVIPPTSVTVAWDEGGNIFIETRDDVLNTDWTDVSGNPNSGDSINAALTLDPITGAPIVVWNDVSNLLNADVLMATNTGFIAGTPGAWAPLDAPVDIVPANSAIAPAVTSDDLPGLGTNINGRATAAFSETAGGVSQIVVRQCTNPGDGQIANCAQLGGALNQDAATDAITPAISIPSLATALLIGESPGNPQPVVAFVEDGELYVKRYDVATDSWVLLADANSPTGSLNAAPGLGIAMDPAIAIDVLGRYSVVWAESNATTGFQTIFVKRFDAAQGISWTALDGALNCEIEQIASNPDIATDSTGRPYITFQETDPAGDTRIVVLAFEG